MDRSRIEDSVRLMRVRRAALMSAVDTAINTGLSAGNSLYERCVPETGRSRRRGRSPVVNGSSGSGLTKPRGSQTNETCNHQIDHPLYHRRAAYGLGDLERGRGFCMGEISVNFCAKRAKRSLGIPIEQHQARDHVLTTVIAGNVMVASCRICSRSRGYPQCRICVL